jgi:hypothetical protein
MKTTLIFILLTPFLTWTQVPGWEFHASVNYPVTGEVTFPGAGIGTNILFAENKTVNFKTGLEINYFHTWVEKSYGGSKGDCHYGVLSVPAMVRFTSKKSVKIFVEAGVYLGIGYGQREASGNPKGIYGLSSGSKYESYFPGVVITPAIGLGGRFPLSERIDLFLKPEFALTVTEFDLSARSFETWYYYARFCVGIHLKPKPKKPTKSGVTKIPPLHP